MSINIVKLCIEQGAHKCEEISVDKLVFSPELRVLCEQNACGLYGQSYTCPPHVGDVHDLAERCRNFERIAVFQNIYPLVDSFDFEGMLSAQAAHNTMTIRIAELVYTEIGRENVLVLGAGGCAICRKCGIQTNEPCRHPATALPSLEAYGINVTKISNVSDLQYINGANTVTYFSGCFFALGCV